MTQWRGFRRAFGHELASGLRIKSECQRRVRDRTWRPAAERQAKALGGYRCSGGLRLAGQADRGGGQQGGAKIGEPGGRRPGGKAECPLAQLIEGRGSRVRFEKDGEVATFHRPHPAKEAKRYQVRDARDFLERIGVRP